MKEVVSQAWKTQPFMSYKITVNNIKINEEKRIAKEFKNFFIDLGPELPKRFQDLQDIPKAM